MNIPFIPVRGLYGSDYLKVRPDYKVIANPYDPREELVIVPAIRPDVALLHGFRADREGNVLVGWGDNKLLAQASHRVIVTVEEVVEGELVEVPRGKAQLIPAVFITAVVPAPFGAHPTACPGFYPLDREHLREYAEAARSEEGFRQYLDRYIFGVADHQGYRQRVAATASQREG